MLTLLFLSYRPYWRCYYSNTDAIIYVVDSMDRDRIGISKQELIAMLEVCDINLYKIYNLILSNSIYNPSNLFARVQLVYTHHVTEYPPAKTGRYLRISPNFQNCAHCVKDLKDNKHDSLHLGRKYARI